MKITKSLVLKIFKINFITLLIIWFLILSSNVSWYNFFIEFFKNLFVIIIMLLYVLYFSFVWKNFVYMVNLNWIFGFSDYLPLFRSEVPEIGLRPPINYCIRDYYPRTWFSCFRIALPKMKVKPFRACR